MSQFEFRVPLTRLGAARLADLSPLGRGEKRRRLVTSPRWGEVDRAQRGRVRGRTHEFEPTKDLP
jgi:hypothetical protein